MQERFAFTTCGNSRDCLGENDASFLINTFRRETERGGEGLLQIFEDQCSTSAELAVMMAFNLKQISNHFH